MTEKTLFKCSVKMLYPIISNMNEILTECSFKISSNGLKAIKTDNSNVCLMDIDIKPSFFDELTKEDITINLNISDLYKALKDNKKQQISFILSDDNNIILSFSNGIKTTIKQIEDYENTFKDLPIMDFKTSMVINSDYFKDIIKNFNNIADTTTFNLNEKGFYLSAIGEINKSEIEINKDAYRILKDYGIVISKYSNEYLIKFLKCLLSNEITLSFNSEYPLMLEYNIKDLFTIKYILAPRITE